MIVNLVKCKDATFFPSPVQHSLFNPTTFRIEEMAARRSAARHIIFIAWKPFLRVLAFGDWPQCTNPMQYTEVYCNSALVVSHFLLPPKENLAPFLAAFHLMERTDANVALEDNTLNESTPLYMFTAE